MLLLHFSQTHGHHKGTLTHSFGSVESQNIGADPVYDLSKHRPVQNEVQEPTQILAGVKGLTHSAYG